MSQRRYSIHLVVTEADSQIEYRGACNDAVTMASTLRSFACEIEGKATQQTTLISEPQKTPMMTPEQIAAVMGDELGYWMERKFGIPDDIPEAEKERVSTQMAFAGSMAVTHLSCAIENNDPAKWHTSHPQHKSNRHKQTLLPPSPTGLMQTTLKRKGKRP